MNILVATNHLRMVGGTENYSYALIEELLRRNHQVEYFSFEKGKVSDLIEHNLKVPFFTGNKSYDLILANHNTIVDSLWKFGFIIQTCHGIYPLLEQPSLYADAHVSISNEVQVHLASKGFNSKIIYNGINCDRFTISNPINERLTSVASFCQSDEANELVEKACEVLNIKFLRVSKFEENFWNIEKVINRADLIVGLGRSAYDAMACGRPVVIFDKRKYSNNYGDGYVKDNLGFIMLNNCSGRYYKQNYTVSSLVEEFLKYDPKDGLYLRNFALRYLNIKNQVDSYLNYADLSKELDYKSIYKIRAKKAVYRFLKKFVKSH
ncbi:glycosyltransferase family protein [Pontibacter russatus]|uniref:glycosyltransferase family 4 protein n=1 Tax=Pontibacter russatus TaxID=2694929 RepID=UPI00137AF923|nr:glycosyltransferase family 4 protein [Pontibacter russatus]